MSKKCRAENNGAQKQRSGVIFMEYTHEKYIEMIDEALKVYLGSVSVCAAEMCKGLYRLHAP